jgi:hypothetical protein
MFNRTFFILMNAIIHTEIGFDAKILNRIFSNILVLNSRLNGHGKFDDKKMTHCVHGD